MKDWLYEIDVPYDDRPYFLDIREDLVQWIIDHYPYCDYQTRAYTECITVSFSDPKPAAHFKLVWS